MKGKQKQQASYDAGLGRTQEPARLRLSKCIAAGEATENMEKLSEITLQEEAEPKAADAMVSATTTAATETATPAASTGLLLQQAP